MNRYDAIMNALFEAVQRWPEELSVLTEQDQQEVEDFFGTPPPQDYREFLQYYGWSAVHRSFIMSNGVLGHIDSFIGISGSKYGLLETYKTNLDTRLPYIVEFGSSDAGILFMSLREKDKGTIYFWDQWEPSKQDFEENLIFVASSFDEFMKLLSSYNRGNSD